MPARHFPEHRSARPIRPIRSARLCGAVVLGVGICAVCGGRALGAANKTNTNTNKNDKNHKSVTIPTVDSQPVSAAQSDLAAARTAAHAAGEKMDALVGKMKQDWEAKPDVAAAIHAVDEARIAYDTAGAPVLEHLQASQDYRAAEKVKEAAEKRVEDLRAGTATASADGPTPAAGSAGDGNAPTDIATASNQALVARNTLTQMRVDALTSDPKVAATKDQLTAAAAKLNGMRAEFDASFKKDSAWVAARKELDDAQAKVAAASKALDTAAKKAVADQAAHDAAVAEQQKLDRENAAQNAKSGKKKK